MHAGVNALYLIPGGVGGTEIYLRELLAALARLDSENRYTVFGNRETGADLTPRAANFRWAPQPVCARFRPARLLYEQCVLPLVARRRRLDVLFNPGFTAPAVCPCPSVTVFHDLQHQRHPEHFRWFDLPFWRFFFGSRPAAPACCWRTRRPPGAICCGSIGCRPSGFAPCPWALRRRSSSWARGAVSRNLSSSAFPPCIRTRIWNVW
jgi:hypothetical protein